MNGNMYLIVLFAAALVLLRRARSMYRPIRGSGFRILLPMIFMAPGLMLLASPQVHSPAWEWMAAFVLGSVLSLPLILTSGYELRDGSIYAKKNTWFLLVFAAMLAIRILLRNELDLWDGETKAALFMAFAFGYIIPWRITSYLRFRRLLPYRTAV